MGPKRCRLTKANEPRLGKCGVSGEFASQQFSISPQLETVKLASNVLWPVANRCGWVKQSTQPPSLHPLLLCPHS